MFVESTNHKGNVAELAIAAEAAKLGIPVLKPLTEHEPYDLVFELGRELLRVQCKWATLKGSVVQIPTSRCRTSRNGYVRSVYHEGEIDALAAYCEGLDQCYLVPSRLAIDRYGLHLRLEPPKNGQRAAINWATQYELGAVAQLAERRDGIAKAGGSNPPSSTEARRPVTTVGAHEFRNLFGWYIQRAAAGESFLVTRRGKPFARLSPP